MQKAYIRIVFALAAVLTLSACAGRDKTPDLMNIRSTTPGPDEFAILPGKPLQEPKDYTFLPEPTPGGSNLTDPTPNADAVAALGGQPARLARDGTLGADGALVARAGRYGVTPGIRQTLAAEDLEFRRRNNGRLLERVFNVNVYFRSYRSQSLDQYAELLRLRLLGVRTPAAPPDPAVFGN